MFADRRSAGSAIFRMRGGFSAAPGTGSTTSAPRRSVPRTRMAATRMALRPPIADAPVTVIGTSFCGTGSEGRLVEHLRLPARGSGRVDPELRGDPVVAARVDRGPTDSLEYDEAAVRLEPRGDRPLDVAVIKDVDVL